MKINGYLFYALVGLCFGYLVVWFIESSGYKAPPFFDGCTERDSIVIEDNKRVVLHFRDCPGAGTIEVSSNKPIFGAPQASRIMSTDNVIGLDAVGYGFRLDREADRRTCTIKWHESRISVTDTVLAIIKSYPK